ncbi:histidine phosphatase family protein [Egibacter rhizosphaerae]|uniref:Histidine phosphatase family protein n=1 Tax=Egibacter rhizosphaerae TaxID=1670831 RepID=A0A411YBW7_9ACTN|nr:histidine phosphatase family protein [Egibacter rhizosphaerae]QBI18647.1 histidine phosphatase family protein [Egibacter rhizosphaerae]
MTVARLVLVRHGQSQWNHQGRWQGHLDSPLTPLGHVQARAAASAIERLELAGPRVIRSDLGRVTETAEPIVAALGATAEVDPRWRERDVGVWAGRTHAEVAETDPVGYAAWRASDDPPRDGGETEAAVRSRVARLLDELAADGRDTVVITHGGPLRHAVACWLGLPVAARGRLAAPRNGALSTARSIADGWQLLAYNEAGHLETAALEVPADSPA